MPGKHSGDLPLSAARVATRRVAGLARMNDFYGNDAWCGRARSDWARYLPLSLAPLERDHAL
jgi:hypothetical protein